MMKMENESLAQIFNARKMKKAIEIDRPLLEQT
jgi:hypothetical protein